MKEQESKPTIIEILDYQLKKIANNPDEVHSVQTIAARMGIDGYTVNHWLNTDKQFQDGLQAVKKAFDNDPWKDTEYEEVMLDEYTLSFGISIVLEETKKRYTV